MAKKRYKPEEIVIKLRQVEVLQSQGMVVSDAICQIGVAKCYSTFRQGWEVIKEKDGKEVSYRWFRTKEKAEAFAMNKLSKTNLQRLSRQLTCPH